MRFMIMVKSTRHFEAGLQSSQHFIHSFKLLCDEMIREGKLLAECSLYPSSSGIRLTYPACGNPNVKAGPFGEGKGLISSFLLIEAETVDEAYEWVSRLPDPDGYGDGEIQICQVLEPLGWNGGQGLNLLESDLRDQIEMLNTWR